MKTNPIFRWTLLGGMLILLLLFSFSIRSGRSVEPSAVVYPPKGIKAEIKWVDPDIQTVVSVPCADFERFFKDRYQSRHLANERIIREWVVFAEKISRSKPVRRQADTRFKINITNHDSTRYQICGNRFLVYINGHTYHAPPAFIQGLLKVMDSLRAEKEIFSR